MKATQLPLTMKKFLFQKPISIIYILKDPHIFDTISKKIYSLLAMEPIEKVAAPFSVWQQCFIKINTKMSCSLINKLYFSSKRKVGGVDVFLFHREYSIFTYFIS